MTRHRSLFPAGLFADWPGFGWLPLRIRVERTEERRDSKHTEFHYGSFYRAVALPAGVRDDTVAARYDNGILEVRAAVGEPAPPGRDIPVKAG